MEDFQSKYSGEQVEEMLDQVASGELGGITAETDPIFSASPAASITEEKKAEWDGKQDKIADLDAIRSGAEKGASALQSVPSEYVTESELMWTKTEGEAGVRLKGTNGTATGNFAISAGDDKTASDGTLFASVASGDHAVAFGFGNTCSGRATLAQGLYNIVTAKDSVAFGQRNTVNGDQAFAAGQKNEVTARLGVAIGYQNKATNTDSIAIGYQNTSSGSASVAMGDTCEANGTSSTAMGYKTKATGAYTSTFGQNTQATNNGEVAMGLYNKSTTSTDASEQTAFSFGIGTSETNRANAFEIKKNGDVYVGDKKLSDFATTTEIEQQIASKYTKPEDGIPFEDLDEETRNKIYANDFILLDFTLYELASAFENGENLRVDIDGLETAFKSGRRVLIEKGDGIEGYCEVIGYVEDMVYFTVIGDGSYIYVCEAAIHGVDIEQIERYSIADIYYQSQSNSSYILQSIGLDDVKHHAESNTPIRVQPSEEFTADISALREGAFGKRILLSSSSVEQAVPLTSVTLDDLLYCEFIVDGITYRFEMPWNPPTEEFNVYCNKCNELVTPEIFDDFRRGSETASSAVQPEDLAKVATSGSYNDLSNKPTIPSQVTESTVSGWGFTKNNGTVTGVKVNGTTYSPTNGIVDLGTIESGGSSDGSGAYAEVNHGTSNTTFALTPNTFHVWDEVASLDLTLGSETSGVANEYLFQFTSGSTATSLVLPDDIKWANGELTIESNKIYQVSILKGLGSVLEWDAITLITFSVAGYSYEAVEGMTWEQWINSEYNSNNYYISSNIVRVDTMYRVTLQGSNAGISPTAVIQKDYAYNTYFDD